MYSPGRSTTGRFDGILRVTSTVQTRQNMYGATRMGGQTVGPSNALETLTGNAHIRLGLGCNDGEDRVEKKRKKKHV